MNTKTLTTLAVVTVLVVAAAGLAVHLRGAVATHSTTPAGPLLEGLAERGNDVGRILVETGEENLTIVRKDDAWTLEEKGGYPVKFDEVRKTVSGLARLEPLQAMTERPELYDRLGVADPGKGETPSTKVTLEDGTGAVLASIIVGNRKPGRGEASIYVRRPGEARSWLARGDIQIPKTVTGWLDTEILKIDRDRVRDVRILHPDGSTLHVSRESKDVSTFTVEGIPEGRELLSPAAASPIGNALSWLNFEDVAPAGDHDVEGGYTATFRTFDGLVVAVHTGDDAGGKTWAHLTAAYEESPELATGEPEAREAPAAAGEPEAEEGSEAVKAAGEGAAAGEENQESGKEEGEAAPTPEDVRKEAEELQAKLSPWVFALPSYKVGYLRKTVAELLKPLPEPKPEPAAAEEEAAPPAAETPSPEDAGPAPSSAPAKPPPSGF